ncbi:MAG: GTP-binding protein [Planctomycetaceae bacterium]
MTSLLQARQRVEISNKERAPMARFAVDNVRNVALVGHGGSGKTTLADHMLFAAGKNSRAGCVDEGNSLLDTEDEEKTRKHSIVSAVAHFDSGDVRVNLIDVPGMPDFVGQGMGALRAVDTAIIVIDAHSGIAANTRKFFKYAGDAGVARMIVINRCDHENINFDGLVNTIREMFGPACSLFNVPVGLGHDLTGVVSTLDKSAAPAGAVMNPQEAGQQVIDAAVEWDEGLMERYLESGQLTPEELAGAIGHAIADGSLIPIFCTAAKSGIGVKELIDGIVRYAPSPTAIVRTAKRGGPTLRYCPTRRDRSSRRCSRPASTRLSRR